MVCFAFVKVRHGKRCRYGPAPVSPVPGRQVYNTLFVNVHFLGIIIYICFLRLFKQKILFRKKSFFRRGWKALLYKAFRTGVDFT